MSQSAMQEITCPKCGKKTSFLVWDSINTMKDPEMKEKVRNDEAFRFHCPECGASALLNYNFLYHQQEDKVLIYVSADGEDASEMAQILDQRGNAFDGYRKRIVRSYNAFKEKLLILMRASMTGSWRSSRVPYGTMSRRTTRIRRSMRSISRPMTTACTAFSSAERERWWHRWNLMNPCTRPSMTARMNASMPRQGMISISIATGRRMS